MTSSSEGITDPSYPPGSDRTSVRSARFFDVRELDSEEPDQRRADEPGDDHREQEDPFVGVHACSVAGLRAAAIREKPQARCERLRQEARRSTRSHTSFGWPMWCTLSGPTKTVP